LKIDVDQRSSRYLTQRVWLISKRRIERGNALVATYAAKVLFCCYERSDSPSQVYLAVLSTLHRNCQIANKSLEILDHVRRSRDCVESAINLETKKRWHLIKAFVV
jgi:hypothetical protein